MRINTAEEHHIELDCLSPLIFISNPRRNHSRLVRANTCLNVIDPLFSTSMNENICNPTKMHIKNMNESFSNQYDKGKFAEENFENIRNPKELILGQVRICIFTVISYILLEMETCPK